MSSSYPDSSSAKNSYFTNSSNPRDSNQPNITSSLSSSSIGKAKLSKGIAINTPAMRMLSNHIPSLVSGIRAASIAINESTYTNSITSAYSSYTPHQSNEKRKRKVINSPFDHSIRERKHFHREPSSPQENRNNHYQNQYNTDERRSFLKEHSHYQSRTMNYQDHHQSERRSTSPDVIVTEEEISIRRSSQNTKYLPHIANLIEKREVQKFKYDNTVGFPNNLPIKAVASKNLYSRENDIRLSNKPTNEYCSSSYDLHHHQERDRSVSPYFKNNNHQQNNRQYQYQDDESKSRSSWNHSYQNSFSAPNSPSRHHCTNKKQLVTFIPDDHSDVEMYAISKEEANINDDSKEIEFTINRMINDDPIDLSQTTTYRYKKNNSNKFSSLATDQLKLNNTPQTTESCFQSPLESLDYLSSAYPSISQKQSAFSKVEKMKGKSESAMSKKANVDIRIDHLFKNKEEETKKISLNLTFVFEDHEFQINSPSNCLKPMYRILASPLLVAEYFTSVTDGICFIGLKKDAKADAFACFMKYFDPVFTEFINKLPQSVRLNVMSRDEFFVFYGKLWDQIKPKISNSSNSSGEFVSLSKLNSSLQNQPNSSKSSITSKSTTTIKPSGFYDSRSNPTTPSRTISTRSLVKKIFDNNNSTDQPVIEIDLAGDNKPTRSLLTRTSRQKPSKGKTGLMFHYPFDNDKDTIAVTWHDLDHLEEGEFLNDVVIEFYLKYLISSKIEEKITKDCYVFSSYFYSQLTSKVEGAITEDAQQIAYDRVKKWTGNVDIFKKKYLIIPINENLHWYMAIICNPEALLSEVVCIDDEKSTSTSTQDTPLVSYLSTPFGSYEEHPNEEVSEEIVEEGQLDLSDTELNFSIYPVANENNDSSLGTDTENLSVSGEDALHKLKYIQSKINSGDSNVPEEIVILEDTSADTNVTDKRKKPISSIEKRLRSSSSKKAKYTIKTKTPPPSKSVEVLDLSQPSPVASLKRKSTTSSGKSNLLETKEEKGFKKQQKIYEEKKKQCKILIFDSLYQRRTKTLPVLKMYLKYEAKKKLGKGLNFPEKNLGMMAKTPIQKNYCDCGVYLLHFAEMFLAKNEEICFDIFNYILDTQKWDEPALRSKRKDIINLMIKLEVSYFRAYGPFSKNPNPQYLKDKRKIEDVGDSSDVEEVL